MAEIITARLGLKKFTSGTDLHPDRNAHNAEQDMLEQLVAISQQGALSARPSAGTGGRFYWATDPTFRLYYDDGTAWMEVNTTGGGGGGAAVLVAGNAAEGSSARAARADHTHSLALATGSAHGAMSSTDKAKLDAADSAATAGALVVRDANGRTQVAAPAAAADATPKSYVDTAVAVLATASKAGAMPAADKATMDAATAFPTGNTLLKRDSAGRAQVGSPNLPGDASTKKYVDDGLAGKSATGHSHVSATTSAPGFMSAADKAKLDIIPTIGTWVPLGVFTGSAAGEYAPEYRVNSGRVELRGSVARGSSTGTALTVALPAGLKPVHGFSVPLPFSTAADPATFYSGLSFGVVGINGNVHYGGQAATDIPVGAFIFLDGISWAIAP